LARTLFKMGFGVFGYSEYPSLIRGGHNTYQINVSQGKITSATRKIDILIALNQETVELHKDELTKGSVIIHDSLKIDNGIKNINIPLMELAKKTGSALARNMVALGAVLYLLDAKATQLNDGLALKFGPKGKKVVEMNKKAVKLGYEVAKKKGDRLADSEWQPAIEESSNHLMTANEATAYGMINAGCKLYAAYPMTPATSIMHVLASKQREHNFVVHQTEDEIAAIGAAIGAATTGVRAATGTSGGGFCLMTESLGMAAITETPLVVINSQRTAPATGLPTWTEQGDLKFMVNASHGEFPRFVIAPGDAEEAFYMIQDGFNLAEKFQVPVIFLMDKMISESDFSMYGVDNKKVAIKREGFLDDNEVERLADYKRYALSKTGISKRAVPGQKGGVHIINSDDHDEYGFSIEESRMRTKMMDKRFKKLKLMEADIKEPVLYGPRNAKLTLVGWGSVKGSVLDAIQDKDVNFLHLTYIWPFPEKRVKAILGKAKRIMLVENNKTGQLGEIIRQETSIEIKNKFLKYDGRPFFREEVVREINRIIKK